jgi:serine/threonine protein phosphatase PrpC
MPRLHLRTTVHSAPGHEQRVNEDAALFRTYRDDTVLAVVADGVGSARAGGEAARRAVDMLADCFAARTPAWSPRRALAEFTSRINRQLLHESQARYEQPELVTTLAAVVIAGSRAYLACLGDSPVYLFRAGRLSLISELHLSTLPGQEGALTQALGLVADASPFFHELDLAPGDTLLLCTDGVAVPLGDERLAQLLARSAAARAIVSTAHDPELPANRERSLPDDATALVLEVTGRDDSASPGQTLEIVPALNAGDTFPDGTLVRPLDDSRRVWLAATPAGDSAPVAHVVLKFPPADATNDEARCDGFLREAWQAARLDFPGFVRARVPTTPVLRYYVQDYIDAPTLRAVLREGPLPVERVLELGVFLARAAQHLSRLDLAHGDIKPDNILVLRAAAPAGAAAPAPSTSAPWDFRLIDLGIAAELYSVAPRAGTASYLAPERFSSAPLSERTEIYAIGATLYECLAGRPPQGEIERFQTPTFSGPPKPPSHYNTAVPGWLDSVLLRCLVPLPEERYALYSEFAHDLDNPLEVKPFHPAGASLLERAPLAFWKVLCAALLLLNLLQFWLRVGQR